MTKTIAGLMVLALVACKGPEGSPGQAGKDGSEGPAGPPGAAGAPGPAGAAGKNATASGTRIVAKYLTTADGAKTFAGWHDATLGVDCAFATASDGALRCLPGAAQAFPSPAVQLLYEDAACTMPVLFVTMGTLVACGVPVVPTGYGQIAQNGSACNGAAIVVNVGAATGGPVGSAWRLVEAGLFDGGTAAECDSFGAPPTGGSFYNVTVVDPSTLAAGSIQ